MKHKIRTEYLQTVFNRDAFQEIVPRAVKLTNIFLKETGFDTIVYTGNSGSAIAYILGYTLNLDLLCIRKPTENSHYMAYLSEEDRVIEGNLTVKKFLIVDDFVSSGNTVRNILAVLNKAIPKAECVGVMVYAQQPSCKKVFLEVDEDKSALSDKHVKTFSCYREDYIEAHIGNNLEQVWKNNFKGLVQCTICLRKGTFQQERNVLS